MVGSELLQVPHIVRTFSFNTVCLNVSKWASPATKYALGLEFGFPLITVNGNQRFERKSPSISVDVYAAYKLFSYRRIDVEELAVNCMCVICGKTLYKDRILLTNLPASKRLVNIGTDDDCKWAKIRDGKYFVLYCTGSCEQIYSIAPFSREEIIDESIARNYLFSF